MPWTQGESKQPRQPPAQCSCRQSSHSLMLFPLGAGHHGETVTAGKDPCRDGPRSIIRCRRVERPGS